MRGRRNRTRIVVEREKPVIVDEQPVVDELNVPVVAWQEHIVTSGRVEYKEADEQFSAAQRYEVRIATVTMRWRDDIAVTDRLVMDGRVFDIKSIRPIDRMLELKVALPA